MDNDKIFRVSFRREFIKPLAEDYFTFASANLRVKQLFWLEITSFNGWYCLDVSVCVSIFFQIE